MRSFVLLLVFAIPPLVACGAAYAKTATDIGKPVCMHFDESSKPTSRIAATATTATSVSTANTKSMVSVPTPSATNPVGAVQARDGGAVDAMRGQNAPHWQAFLPGMFR
ncbi:MAG: hypothetical protein ABI365_08935 [Lysobacteraceae bacterium]